jgi:hypothetical protein
MHHPVLDVNSLAMKSVARGQVREQLNGDGLVRAICRLCGSSASLFQSSQLHPLSDTGKSW